MSAPGAGEQAPMRPEDDPGWSSYAETLLVFHGQAPFEIDLAHPVAPETPAALARLGLTGPFGLVTPCNPRGLRSRPEENEARLVRFLAELELTGKRFLRVDGVSPDRQHVEPGVALAWSQADVIALARKWGQSAIYWWDGGRFWVLGALTEAAPWPLGGPA